MCDLSGPSPGRRAGEPNAVTPAAAQAEPADTVSVPAAVIAALAAEVRAV